MSGPSPPANLASRTPQFITLNAGTILHRFWTVLNPANPATPNDPVFYDISQGGRLNAPDATYGVLYTAEDALGAFSETFLRTPGRRQIDPGFMGTKGYVKLTVQRPLRLIDFNGKGLPILDATAAVPHGDPPYGNSQTWSKALRDHPSKPDGIAYSGRHDPSQVCYAIFDSSDPPVREHSRSVKLDDNWFWELADHYEVGLAP